MKLFSSTRDNRHRHNPRLAFDTLGDRIVPAIARPTLSGGVLTVQGDYQNDNVRVYASGNTLVVKDNTTVITGGYYYFTASQVNSIVLAGGEGNDYLKNETSKPTTFGPGNGNDICFGGSGNDIFYTSTGDDWHDGGAGNDTFYTKDAGDVFVSGSGSDILDRTFSGQRGFFTDGSSTDLTLGQVTGRLTAVENHATGGITVALDPQNSDRLLLTGPSGSTLVLVSDWYKEGNAFKTPLNSPISYEIDSQTTVPLVPGFASKFTQINLVASSPSATAGNFSSVSFAGFTVGQNPLTPTINSYLGNTGISVTMPDVAWGLGLGSTIRNTDAKAPLNNAVPYFYKTSVSGASLSTSNANLILPGSGTSTVAFSPVEQTAYISKGSKFAAAVSVTGAIAYRPTNVSWNLSDPNILGHVYLRGAGNYKMFGFTGDVVLDLDADDNGSSAGFGRVNSAFTNFANWKNTNSSYNDANELGGQGMWDIALGFNGDVDLSLKDVLTLDLGTTSVWFKPGQLAFAASITNPFEGLPVLDALGSARFDVQGNLQWTPGTTNVTSWGLWAKANAKVNFGNLKAANLYLEATQARNGIYATASVNSGRLGTYSVTGDFNFDGSASLTGHVGRYIEKHYNGAGVHASSNFNNYLYINWNGSSFSLGASFNGSVGVKQNQLGEASANFSANLNLSITSAGNVNISGSGYLGVNVWIYTPEQHYGDSMSFSFDNDSFTVNVPVLDTVTFNW